MTSPHGRRVALALAVVVGVGGCGSSVSSTPPPTLGPIAPPAPTATTPPPTRPVARDLHGPRTELPPGRWTRPGFVPRLTFVVDDGWAAAEVAGGFVSLERGEGNDLISVQFARPDGIYRGPGQLLAPTTADAAGAAISGNTALTVVGSSSSHLGGHGGLALEIENPSTAGKAVQVLHVPPGPLVLAPGRRLWVSLLDTPEGLVVIMVGGSATGWDDALAAAEPILESVTLGI